MACYFMRSTPEGKLFPCGTCPKCLVRRTDAWIFRCLQQVDVSSSVHWIRLSYDDIFLPRSPNGFATLRRSDVQKFIKRLRKAHPPGHKIKYFGCAEYGSRFKRPHYHILLYNVDIELVSQCWSHPKSHIPYGEVYLDPRPVNAACIGYTVGYMFKGRDVGLHARDDRKREFLMMSKQLGINYVLDPLVRKYHHADINRNFVTMPSGNRSALPRYYNDKLFRPKPTRVYRPDGRWVEHLCPVAKLAYDYHCDDRSLVIDPLIARANKLVTDAYIKRYGSLEGFRRDINVRRYWAIVAFQKKGKTRVDR